MANATSAGVHLKFQRAREHVAELERRVREFIDSKPFEVYEEEEQATGDLVTRVRIHRQPPAELGLVIGDIVHNARTALDHLAWQLVLAGGNEPSDTTAFPISKSRDAFLATVNDRLKGATKQAISTVKKLKPYRGGDERFWRLHRLDIEDKHHLLILVGAAHRNLVVSMSFLGTEDMPRVDFPPVAIKPGDRQYPLQDGTVLFRDPRAAREADQGTVGTQYGFTIELAFSDNTAVAGETVMPTLPNLVEEIRQLVDPLIRMLR